MTRNQEDEDPAPVNGQQYGYKQYEKGQLFYYMLPSVFRDKLCRHYNPNTVIEMCTQNGLMVVGQKSRNTVQKRIPALNKNMRLYKFTDKVFGDDDGDEE